MKRPYRLILPLLSLFIASGSQAATESSDVRAEIVARAITLVNTRALDFGKILPFSTAGYVQITASGSLSAVSAQVTDTSSVASSAWTVTGEQNGRFTISLPADNTVVLSNLNASTMELTNFSHNAGSAPQLNSSGSANFNVGARLQVGASQEPGLYSGTFNVTVNYL